MKKKLEGDNRLRKKTRHINYSKSKSWSKTLRTDIKSEKNKKKKNIWNFVQKIYWTYFNFKKNMKSYLIHKKKNYFKLDLSYSWMDLKIDSEEKFIKVRLAKPILRNSQKIEKFIFVPGTMTSGVGLNLTRPRWRTCNLKMGPRSTIVLKWIIFNFRYFFFFFHWHSPLQD